ncbi:unnamed protein product [Peronospora belbahrii]|uniref:Uncharacterized protein n=1 Tax=Peronospora belbahrii TaxID=622444 RepID=A0ABN8CZC6_9STRA|nr:unnamed protein product [Peronospora belbahrii]
MTSDWFDALGPIDDLVYRPRRVADFIGIELSLNKEILNKVLSKLQLVFLAPLPLAAPPFPANQSEVSTTRHSEENEVSHDEKEERGFPARFGIPEALETNGAHGADELSVEETDKVLEVLQPIAQNFFVKQPDQLKDVEDWEEFILGVELASSSSQTTFSEKLAAKCSYNELLQIIAAGKELRPTDTRAHAVEKELRVTGTRDHAAEKELRVTGKRAHAAEKTVDDVKNKVRSLELWLEKNYPTNKLKQLVRTRTETFFRAKRL